MSRYLKRSRRVTVFLGILMVAGLAWTARAQQQPPAADPSSNFTGGEVTTLKAEGRLSYYVFAPGGRTKWHTHEGGQLILAEEGLARTQIRGQGVRELRAGESTWSPRIRRNAVTQPIWRAAIAASGVVVRQTFGMWRATSPGAKL